MKTTIDELGTIDLSGTVVVSDPCYDREVWCMMPGVKVRPGRYRVFVARQNEGRFGIRIACLMAVHDDYEAAEINNWDDDCSGSIGVDSGQCGIFDDAIYPKLNDDPAFESFYGDIDDEQVSVKSIEQVIAYCLQNPEAVDVLRNLLFATPT